jgi:hypothetical protein
MLTPLRTDLMAAEKAAGVSLWYVAMRLGLSDRAETYILGQVRLLTEHEGFPPPLPEFVLKSSKRRDGVHRGSRWPRPVVDAWFDGRMPPELAALVDDRRAARDAAALDANAQLAAA